MANDDSLEEQRLMSQLNAMRAAFSAGQYRTALGTLEELGELVRIRSGIRVEAVALAARAHLAMGDTKAARQLLRQVWNASLKNHRLYRHVAMACLELGEYRRAIVLTEKAAELAEAASAAKLADQTSTDQSSLAGA